MDKAEEAVWWLLGCVLGGASGQKADACTQKVTLPPLVSYSTKAVDTI